MIVVVNLNPDASTRRGTRRIVRALKRLAPHTPVVERHFARLTPQRLATLGASAVVLGPQGVPFDAYRPPRRAHLFGLIRGLEGFVLGICGGHQALALAWGGKLAPVHGGVASGSYAGHRQEAGERRVDVVDAGDPLLSGLGAGGVFVVSHVEGVVAEPPGFRLVARGDPCRIQALRREGHPQWGVQFHPELGGDGDVVLRRFLRLVAAGIVPPDDDAP